jgi:hypothetical protein
MMRFGKESVWCSLSCELCFFSNPFFCFILLVAGIAGGREWGREVCCVWFVVLLCCVLCGEVGCCI